MIRRLGDAETVPGGRVAPAEVEFGDLAMFGQNLAARIDQRRRIVGPVAGAFRQTRHDIDPRTGGRHGQHIAARAGNGLGEARRLGEGPAEIEALGKDNNPAPLLSALLNRSNGTCQVLLRLAELDQDLPHPNQETCAGHPAHCAGMTTVEWAGRYSSRCTSGIANRKESTQCAAGVVFGQLHMPAVEAQNPGLHASLRNQVGDCFAVGTGRCPFVSKRLSELLKTTFYIAPVRINHNDKRRSRACSSPAKRLDRSRVPLAHPLLSTTSAAWQGLGPDLVSRIVQPVKIAADQLNVPLVLGEDRDQGRLTHAPIRAL